LAGRLLEREVVGGKDEGVTAMSERLAVKGGYRTYLTLVVSIGTRTSMSGRQN
jgi:hypothetical protein